MRINYLVIRKRGRKAVKRILGEEGGDFVASLVFSDSRNSQYCSLWG